MKPRLKAFSVQPSYRVISFVAFLLLSLAIPFSVFLVHQVSNTHTIRQRAALGYYHVEGNTIIDPAGNKFIVKGVNDMYGPFLALNGGVYSPLQYQYAQRDLAMMRSLGINFIRVLTSQLMLESVHAEMKTQLDNVIRWAEQEGFVVEVTDVGQPISIQGPDSVGMRKSIQVVQYLARTYAHDSHVWIDTINEPECYGGNYCNDWDVWYADQKMLIQAIRDRGFQNPVIVDTPRWSTSLRNVDNSSIDINTQQYSLHDRNLIYAVHIYDFNEHSFWGQNDTQSNDDSWGNYATHHAVIVEELGPEVNYSLYMGWMDGFLDYLVNWVNTKNGSGAVAFLWFWSSGDSMTGADSVNYKAGPTLNQWGQDYINLYLDKVPGTKSVGTPVPYKR